MRVGIIIPEVCKIIKGGGFIQLKSFIETSRKLGYKVNVLGDSEFGKYIDLKEENYDVLLLHNISLAPFMQWCILKIAKNNDICTAVFPLLAPLNLRDILISSYDLKSFLKMMFYHRLMFSMLSIFTGFYHNYFKKCIREADIVVTASKVEAKYLKCLDKGVLEKYVVLRCGIPKNFWKESKDVFTEKYGIEDFFIYVGRISPSKNVLRMVKAFHRARVNSKLVIIGRIAAEDSYTKRVMDVIRKDSRILLIRNVPPYSSLLKSAYAAASCAIHIGYYVVGVGLFTLEAASYGNNLIVTDAEIPREYLGDFPMYVDPLNTKEITRAIETLDGVEKNFKLAKLVKNNYTWDVIVVDFWNNLKEKVMK